MAEQLGRAGFFVWHGNYYALQLTEALGLEPDGLLRVDDDIGPRRPAGRRLACVLEQPAGSVTPYADWLGAGTVVYCAVALVDYRFWLRTGVFNVADVAIMAGGKAAVGRVTGAVVAQPRVRAPAGGNRR